MPTRLRNGLALLIAFFVLGASSQAAVCEFSCALQTEQSGCHSSASAHHGVASDAMDMADMHCGGSMQMSPTQVTTNTIGSPCAGSCNHLHALVFAGNSVTGIHGADLQWSVVDVKQVHSMLRERDRIASKVPPLRMAVTSRRLMSLRV